MGGLQSRGMPSVQASFQFLLLTFHLPLLGGMGEGCPFRGSPGPHMVAPRHTAQAKGFPLPTCCVHCQCCAHPLSPLPDSEPTSSLGQGLLGAGPSWGPRKCVWGEGKEMLSYLTLVPPGEGPRGRGRGAWRVLFYLLFPDFFVSKLADLYYTRIANKGRI